MAVPRYLRRRIFYTSLATVAAIAVWGFWPAPKAPPLTPANSAPAAAEAPAKPPSTPAPPPPKVRTYLVKAGDNAGSIATSFGLRTSTILWSNNLTESSLLQVGQSLLIPAQDGLLHRVEDGDTLWDIAVSHAVTTDDVIRANPDISPDAIQPGMTMLVPGGAPVRRVAAVVSRSGQDARPAFPVTPGASGTGLIWPVSGEITSYFGWRTHPVYGTRNYHEGLDIAVPEGTPVKAVAAGRVTLAEWYGGYGLTIKVRHADGTVSRYSHNSALLVAVGQTVEAGQVIARSGNTGVSTGPHLDFGLYRGDEPVDPLSLLP